MIIRPKDHSSEFNVWPCFVDALSSLLMIIIFVVIGFCISHMFLTKTLTNREASLEKMKETLVITQEEKETLFDQNKNLSQREQDLKKHYEALLLQLTQLKSEMQKEQQSHQQTLNNLRALQTTTMQQQQQWQAKEEMLEKNMQILKNQNQEKDLSFKEQSELLAQKIQELSQLQKELAELQKQIPENIFQNPDLLKYRSDFFASLQNVIGGRSDIRVVGDRFVFQSEVLFQQGSDKIEEEGQKVLNAFIDVLKEIMVNIPSSINWVLIVDGHTDRIPIHNDRFDSNWELSSSRAVSVVKYLIAHGIPAGHLAAAGFAEYAPLTTEPNKLAKNRRIEIRLDQR